MYVANQSGSRIDRFDLNGQYLDTHLLNDFDLSGISLEGFIPPRTLVLSSFVHGAFANDYTLVEVGDTWQKTHTFRIDQTEGETLPQSISAGVDMAVSQEELVVGSVRDYTWSIYDASGKLQRVVSRDVDYIVRPGVAQSGNSISMRVFSSMSPPRRLKTGYWLGYASWPTNVKDPDAFTGDPNAPKVEKQNALDLYDAEGRLLYSVSPKDKDDYQIGNLLHVDAEGKLYTSSGTPYPHARRYRVVIDEQPRE